MKLEFLLRIFCSDEKIVEFTFHCTKRQIDKVFYSFAFAACASNIRCARLYNVVRKSSGVISSSFFVNEFNVNDPFYRMIYASECSRLPDSLFDPPHLEIYRNV